MDVIFLVVIGIIVGLVLLALFICCLIKCLKSPNNARVNSAPIQHASVINAPPASTVISIEPSESQKVVRTSIQSDYSYSDEDEDDYYDDVEREEGEKRKYVGSDNKMQQVRRQKSKQSCQQPPVQTARCYQIREKIFSLGDDFVIKDEAGNRVFFVRSKLLSFGDKLVFEDMAGNGLLKIRQEVFNWLKTYKILSARTNQELATVKQKFTFFGSDFAVDSIYGHYDVNGNILAHSFTLAKGGRIVATVNKKFFAFSDTYGVQVAGTEDHAFILALVIVLDQAVHDKK